MTERVKSLAEMRAEAIAGTGADPWACPVCGCEGPHPVKNTYDTASGRKRRRICRNCGQGLIPTTEVPVPKGYKLAVIPIDEARDAA